MGQCDISTIDSDFWTVVYIYSQCPADYLGEFAIDRNQELLCIL